MRSIPVSSAPLISIARACGRSVPRGGHGGYRRTPKGERVGHWFTDEGVQFI